MTVTVAPGCSLSRHFMLRLRVRFIPLLDGAAQLESCTAPLLSASAKYNGGQDESAENE
jgi:hypothetical protein